MESETEDNIRETLWMVTDKFLLWFEVSGYLVSRRAEQLFAGDFFFVLEKDDYGNINVVTKYGIRYITYTSLKRRAKQC